MNSEPQLPLISVIMPIHNGAPTLDRAIRSIEAQMFKDWEVIAVDDGSTDATYDCLCRCRRHDDRLRVLRLEKNRGPAAARNEGLRHARGPMIAYLDCDDEYYPNYLDLVAHFRSRGDVLMFGYDVVDDEKPGEPLQRWEPGPYRNVLFDGNIAAPLGVAHRRELAFQVGGFDEELWSFEDWDLWKRIARTGAEFAFLPLRSGIYHKRQSSRSRGPRLTERQRAFFASRLQTGQPLYTRAQQPARPIRKLALWASVFPFAGPDGAGGDISGAAYILTRAGFACQGFCPSKVPGAGEVDFENALASSGLPVQARHTSLAHHTARMTYTRAGDVPVSVLQTHSTRQAEYRDGEGAAIMDYVEKFLLAYRPDAMIACNPGPQPDLVFDLVFHVGKAIDIPTVLWVDGGSAINLTVMQSVDYCIVNSDHLRRRYWEAVGLVCQTLPHAFEWDQMRLRTRDPRAVAILTGDSRGEALVAAKIAEKLRRTRPDIPVVLADQHGGPFCLAAHGHPAPESEPSLCEERLSARETLSLARVLLVPSLGHGLFDRTVAQAMINGIPVVVSDRGALPETVGTAGLVIEIPSCHQPESGHVPRADDISPWLDAVIRLWDDPVFYGDASDRTVEHSLCWHPSRTIPIYTEFFRNLRRQPGPPLLPKWSDESLAGLRLPE